MRDAYLRRPAFVWGLACLLSVGCWGSKDSTLFSSSAGAGANSNAGQAGSLDANGGGGASNVQGGAGVTGGAGAAVGGTAQAGTAQGGTAQAGTAQGGTAQAGSSAGGSDGGGGGGQVVIPEITDCAMVEQSVTSELNGHCYRVNFMNLDFDAATLACKLAGGHLVTMDSHEENAYVATLHEGEHWIGATDGRGPGQSGAGTYAWVTEEPWTYAQWSDGQPNAVLTDCPNGGPASCYEHCAFQWDGGDWNDRSCWHTILSICEWDVEKADGSGGGDAGGAAAGGAAAGGAFP